MGFFSANFSSPVHSRLIGSETGQTDGQTTAIQRLILHLCGRGIKRQLRHMNI